MEEYQSAQPEEQHLFDDFKRTLTQAGSGKRFANYLIDLISFYVFMYFFSYVIVAVSMDLAIMIYGETEGFNFVGNLIVLLLYGLYMGLTEAVFRGRSLGKLVTGTIAVNADGSRIGGSTALLRGLSRAVPFNAFSALGSPCYPWHDRWNNTYVVEYKDFAQPL
ncbi:MAG: RDD family protein [Sphingobacteriales bacterium]|nr:RDD family protein [Sphingobacteriales bacterium]